jgi:predicted transcriptional regulator
MAYILKPKTVKLVNDQYGKHIEITKVGLYDDETFIKWVKITDLVMQAIVINRILTNETATKIIDGIV